MRKFGLLLLSAIMLISCNSSKDPADLKKGSSGKTLEVLLVADNGIYRDDTKQLIDSLFRAPIFTLPQPEPLFDIVNIPLSSYQNTEMFRNCRNIIICDVDPNNPNKVYMHIDEYAAPQVVFDFAVKTSSDLRYFIKKYESKMVDEMMKAEHRRVIKAFKGINGYDVNAQVQKKFGFELTFSNEFMVAKEDDGFMWVLRSAKDFDQGLLIDVFPYEDDKIFAEKNLLDRIDSTMRHHVPCGEGYMGCERRKNDAGYYLAPIVRKQVMFDNSDFCIETRGCWRTFGDFMGGPFVSYTFLSPDRKDVIQLTGFVYCPRNKPYTKRDLLLQMESVCWGIKF